MGFIESQSVAESGGVWSPRGLVIALIQRLYSGAQRRKDTIHPGIFLSGGLSNPHDADHSLNDEPVGEDETKNK